MAFLKHVSELLEENGEYWARRLLALMLLNHAPPVAARWTKGAWLGERIF